MRNGLRSYTETRLSPDDTYHANLHLLEFLRHLGQLRNQIICSVRSGSATGRSSCFDGDASDTLVNIFQATRRLRDGSFGSCEACSSPIALRKLRLSPLTTLCAVCEARYRIKQGA